MNLKLVVSLILLLNVPLVDSVVGIHYPEDSFLTKKQITELQCLSENIYGEARGEPFNGKIAVAFVTLNRYKLSTESKSICNIVKLKKNGFCQFSWFCNNLQIKKIPEDIKRIAKLVYFNHSRLHDLTYGATYFHASHVSPDWKDKFVKTVKIGNHIFYKRK